MRAHLFRGTSKTSRIDHSAAQRSVSDCFASRTIVLAQKTEGGLVFYSHDTGLFLSRALRAHFMESVASLDAPPPLVYRLFVYVGAVCAHSGLYILKRPPTLALSGMYVKQIRQECRQPVVHCRDHAPNQLLVFCLRLQQATLFRTFGDQDVYQQLPIYVTQHEQLNIFATNSVDNDGYTSTAGVLSSQRRYQRHMRC